MSGQQGQAQQWGPFELLERLGRGGVAEVYRARVLRGPLQGQVVALKRVLPERAWDAQLQAALRQEAELGRCLEHPNIVRLLEAGELRSGGPWLALELVEGTDLGRLLAVCKRRGIRLPVELAVLLVQRVLEALAHSHLASGPGGRPLGLVHCDVSPSNVLVSLQGEVKLADFGGARVRGRPEPQARRLGKPFYRSPELIAGEVSQAADLWGAAIILYELLALEYPFPGGTPDQVEAAVCEGRLVPLAERAPQVPERLVRLVERALAPAASQRFSSAAQFARALAPLCDERVATPLALTAVVRGLLGMPYEAP